MPIVALKDMLQHAYDHKYAIAAFNVNSLDVLEGVLKAAERCRSPVILALETKSFTGRDINVFMQAMEAAARKSAVPVAIQMHHISDPDSLTHAINSGCNGVMIVTGHEAENSVTLSRELVKISHACGVPVEGRLSNELDIETIKNYVSQTSVDFLLVTSEIDFWRRQEDPKPDYSKLQDVKRALSIPLVIYGGAGLSADQCQYLITVGVAKINFGNALYSAVNSQIRSNAETGRGDYNRLMAGVCDSVNAETEVCIRLVGSTGYAADLLEYCKPWVPVEHLIVYNVTGVGENEVNAMMAEGQLTLSKIPGVREVITAVAVKEDAQFRYSWLIRFCHPAVIDSYREHPLHVAFADNLFRPVAADRISIDYIWNEKQTVKDEMSNVAVS